MLEFVNENFSVCDGAGRAIDGIAATVYDQFQGDDLIAREIVAALQRNGRYDPAGDRFRSLARVLAAKISGVFSDAGT